MITQTLDLLLTYLKSNVTDKEIPEIHAEFSPLEQRPVWELFSYMNKLVKDGYAIEEIKKQYHIKEGVETIREKYIYVISVEGLLFLERGGYKRKYKEEKAKYNWTIAKTIANILNAIMIIVIGAFSVYVANKANVVVNENKSLNNKIDSLVKVLNDTSAIKK